MRNGDTHNHKISVMCCIALFDMYHETTHCYQIFTSTVQTDVALNDPVLVEWVTPEIRSKIQALQDSGTSKSSKVKLNVSL